MTPERERARRTGPLRRGFSSRKPPVCLMIGVYPLQQEAFPLGTAMNRNLTIKAGNCDHRRYVPGLLSKITTGGADRPWSSLSRKRPRYHCGPGPVVAG
jgi:hypothetical protein